jgi:hypothetical protein
MSYLEKKHPHANAMQTKRLANAMQTLCREAPWQIWRRSFPLPGQLPKTRVLTL